MRDENYQNKYCKHNLYGIKTIFTVQPVIFRTFLPKRPDKSISSELFREALVGKRHLEERIIISQKNVMYYQNILFNLTVKETVR